MILLFLQNCSFKLNNNPIDIIVKNRKIVLNSISNELNLETNTLKHYWFLNSMDRNNEIMTYFKESNFNEKINSYLVVQHNDIIENGNLFEDKELKVINTSLPIYDLDNNKIFIVIQISSFFEKNIIGCEEYIFIFKVLKNNIITRCAV